MLVGNQQDMLQVSWLSWRFHNSSHRVSRPLLYCPLTCLHELDYHRSQGSFDNISYSSKSEVPTGSAKNFQCSGQSYTVRVQRISQEMTVTLRENLP